MKRIIKVLVLIVLLFVGLSMLKKTYYRLNDKLNDNTYNKVVEKVNNYKNIDNDTKNEIIVQELSNEFINKDIKGIIKIGNNLINVPIVQTDNNEYYVRHSVNKKYNVNGAVFIDYRNNINSKKILVYGHSYRRNMNRGFSNLFKYKYKEFLNKNQIITLNIDGKVSNWQIFSAMVVKYDDNQYIHTKVEFKDDNDFINHIKWIKDNSLYDTNVEVSPSDRILTIQTCYYEPEGSYFIINAREI